MIDDVKRWHPLVMAVGLVPLLAGCAAGCTAADCGSNVSVDLSKVGARYGNAPVNATWCVGGDCGSETLVLADPRVNRVLGHPLPPGSPADTGVPVALTLSRGGTVLLTTKADTTLRKVTPNGDQCAPVCWSSALVLVGTTLQPAPPSA